MTTTDLTLIIPSTETVDENGYTRGWIVPASTEATADLELEAVDHIDIPATEDEAEWWQGLRAAAAYAGWAIEDPITDDRSTIIASVVKA